MFKVYDAKDRHVAGDEVLDEVVKAAAMLQDGYVLNDQGEMVYESPNHRKAREEAERAAEEAEAGEEPESLTGVVTPPEE